MDPVLEEQLDYGEDDLGEGIKLQNRGSEGTIPLLTDDGVMPEDDDEYDDLYNDVNVGEGFMQSLLQRQQQQPLGPATKLDDYTLGADQKNASSARNLSANVLPDVGRAGGDVRSNYHYQESLHRTDSRDPFRNQVAVANQRDLQENGSLNSEMLKRLETRSASMQSASLGNDAHCQPVQLNRVAVVPGNGYKVMTDNARNGISLADSNGPSVLYVGELHWWTTDEDLESVMSQYGKVKDIKFFDERASGKSKGYCQVEFYDAAAAAACKNGMDGYVFNNRPCVVAFASADSVKQIASGPSSRGHLPSQQQGRRQMNDPNGRVSGGTNYLGNDRPGSGRGGNRGPGGNGAARGRGASGVRSNAGVPGIAGVGAYGNALGLTASAALAAPSVGLMQPPSILGAAFDPAFLSRGVYGGFPGTAIPGMLPQFPAVSAVRYPGVAPHVNPAFFSRGLPANGIGMLFNNGIEGPGAGAYASTGRWTGEEPSRMNTESSYGDNDASQYYGEANNERIRRSNLLKESPGRRYHDEGEQSRDKSQDITRDNSTRSQSRSRTAHNEERSTHSRDSDYAKRRRMP